MSKHVVIVGGGVVGLCTAWYCQQQGQRVTVIDQQPADHDGCSYGNAGMVVPSHVVPLAAPGMISLGLRCLLNPESPFAIRPLPSVDLLRWGWQFWRAATPQRVARAAPVLKALNCASRQLYVELDAAWGGEFGLTQRGLLMLCQTQHAVDEEAHAAELARGLGLPVEVVDADGAAQLDPDVTMNIAGGVYFPADCHLVPGLFLRGLQRRLEAGGCEFRWSSPVQGWQRAAEVVQGVVTSTGVVTGDEYVIAAGSWSGTVARDLGLRLPLQPGKGYSLTLDAPRQLPRLCSIGVEGRIAITPLGEKLRVGGTMELGNGSPSLNQRRIQGIIKSFCGYFPEFQPRDFSTVAPWQGLRPCSPDGLPYVGKTRHYRNLIIATGHAMMGLSLGPITGRLVSQLVAGEVPEIELSLLAPERFESASP